MLTTSGDVSVVNVSQILESKVRPQQNGANRANLLAQLILRAGDVSVVKRCRSMETPVTQSHDGVNRANQWVQLIS
jgi:hypothetical protein